jgi:hypothetical protein
MLSFRYMQVGAVLVAPLLGSFPEVVPADVVTDVVIEALQQYEQGQLSSAADNLEFAAGLVRQQKAEVMKAILPKPLSGWEVEESLSTMMAAASYGGGTAVQRVFQQGEKMVMVGFITDSMVLQSALMMFNDPAFAAANGGRFDKIAGNRAVVKYDSGDKSGEIGVVVNKRVLVSVRGSQVAESDLYSYAKLIDFAGLSRLP